jgi:hypothetical protein
MKLPVLWEATLCCCTSSSFCFGGLECLLIRSSIATKGTFGLPDSEEESSTILWKVLTWWRSALYQKTWIFNTMWCSVVLQLLSELFLMNVLEIAYNCFLINYKACIWRFVSSGMLIFVSRGMVPSLLKKHIGFILNHKFDMKKSPLDHEFSAFLQNFT